MSKKKSDVVQIEVKRVCPKCGHDKYKSNGTQPMPGLDCHLRGEYLGKLVGIRRCICQDCGTHYKVKVINPPAASAPKKVKKEKVKKESAKSGSMF